MYKPNSWPPKMESIEDMLVLRDFEWGPPQGLILNWISWTDKETKAHLHTETSENITETSQL